MGALVSEQLIRERSVGKIPRKVVLLLSKAKMVKVIRAIKNSKSPFSDGISMEVLK